MTAHDTVYVSSTTTRYGHTVYHVADDCVRLAENYREVEREVLFGDLKACQWCGEGEPARGDPTGDGHHESLLAAAEEHADEPDLVTDGGQDRHPNLRTYRDTKGLMGPVDLNDDRPEWADYAIGEEIAFRSDDHGVLTAPVAGYSVHEEYRGLPCVWTPGEIADEIDAALVAISEDRHVRRGGDS